MVELPIPPRPQPNPDPTDWPDYYRSLLEVARWAVDSGDADPSGVIAMTRLAGEIREGLRVGLVPYPDAQIRESQWGLRCAICQGDHHEDNHDPAQPDTEARDDQGFLLCCGGKGGHYNVCEVAPLAPVVRLAAPAIPEQFCLLDRCQQPVDYVPRRSDPPADFYWTHQVTALDADHLPVTAEAAGHWADTATPDVVDVDPAVHVDHERQGAPAAWCAWCQTGTAPAPAVPYVAGLTGPTGDGDQDLAVLASVARDQAAQDDTRVLAVGPGDDAADLMLPPHTD